MIISFKNVYSFRKLNTARYIKTKNLSQACKTENHESTTTHNTFTHVFHTHFLRIHTGCTDLPDIQLCDCWHRDLQMHGIFSFFFMFFPFFYNLHTFFSRVCARRTVSARCDPRPDHHTHASTARPSLGLLFRGASTFRGELGGTTRARRVRQVFQHR
jgi:hypothetical protein